MTEEIKELLAYVNGSNYENWINVGYILKNEGCSVSDWEAWSRTQLNYHLGECEKKWQTFNKSGLTIASLVDMAKKNGYRYEKKFSDGSLSWDSYIGGSDLKKESLVDLDWLEIENIPRPKKDWEKDGAVYIRHLFDETEYVGYVPDAFQKEDSEKFIPKGRGIYTRKAGELISEIEKSSTADALYCNSKNAGAWIRFNPLDGEGVRDANVTDYRYCLIEADNEKLEKQYSIIKQMKLPCAVIMCSGGKSIHAIVHIDAGQDFELYKKRVNKMYQIVEKNGLKLDTQNKNPSRLSRLPGVRRGKRQQYIIDLNAGFQTYEEWDEYLDEIEDNLPDIESFSDAYSVEEKPDPMLIDDIVSAGEKMIISGPSKAGKSFLLLQLCAAVAEGSTWLGFQCHRGKVLYINLELKAKSCRNRLREIYRCRNYSEESTSNIHIWNLRGKAEPLDKLVKKIVKRTKLNNYAAVVIDPVYKIITGDENSAKDMGHFCNQFDILAGELNTAVIYAHHHSKGDQGHKKAVDRASGSGVFGRDPDVITDLLELDLKEEKREQICDMLSTDVSDYFSCWEIGFSFRDRKPISPRKLIYKYPLHGVDTKGLLDDVKASSSTEERYKNHNKEKRDNAQEEYFKIYQNLYDFNGQVTVNDMVNSLGVSHQSVYKNIKKWKKFRIGKGGLVTLFSTTSTT